MKLIMIAVIACATLWLAACHAHGHKHHPHHGGFCPPGQAKKGNC
jgi:hypothetical protein